MTDWDDSRHRAAHTIPHDDAIRLYSALHGALDEIDRLRSLNSGVGPCKTCDGEGWVDSDHPLGQGHTEDCPTCHGRSALRPPLPPVAPGASALVARLLDPQPPPVGDGPSVTDEALRLVDDEQLRELLRARREQGRERYGRELTASNGRDALADAAQEALDLMLYLVQLQMEGRGLILWPLAKTLRQIVDVAEDEEARALPHELPSMPVEVPPRSSVLIEDDVVVDEGDAP